MQIYLVTGSSGAYSDHSEWPVKAFLDEKKANAYAAALPELYAELLKVRPEDIAKARLDCETNLTRYPNMYGSRPPDIDVWARQEARNRAHNDMRQLHDPNFSGSDDVCWDVSSLELE